MDQSLRTAFVALLLVLTLLPAASVSRAADFKRETIYQIITDRFFDGSTANNNPPQTPGIYDSSKTNWRAYWGGDLAGIQQKMSYLAGMGVTAIWISHFSRPFHGLKGAGSFDPSTEVTIISRPLYGLCHGISGVEMSKPRCSFDWKIL